MNHTLEQSADTIRPAWQELLTQEPNLRIREAAKRLGLGEVQLLATTISEDCVRLRGPWPAFLKRLPELGFVPSLTRNDACILEHKGHFDQVNAFGKGNHW